jgi:4-hydroxythreonine-4-phosphate dehydrogenase
MNYKYNQKMNKNDIRVAITHGDYNGIGYEVIIKTFMDKRVFDFCIPVLYGTPRLFSYHRNTINNANVPTNNVKSGDKLIRDKLNIVSIYPNETNVELGTSSTLAGELSFFALDAATNDLEDFVDVLVTAPINKDNIQSKDFKFPGHTEYLGMKFNSKNTLMIMVGENVKVAVATGHIPISKVPEVLSIDLIKRKVNTYDQSLKRDFGIRKPKIAVLGLNPHAGDNGLLGKEEIEIIEPALQQLKEEGVLAFGPFPADGFFAAGDFAKFDGVLAMYHDQGLIPFKTLEFDAGVNYTAGLPVVRTSPAHGTAYGIAGKDLANPKSFREALYLALDIYKNRELFDELNENPLEISYPNVYKDTSVDELEDLDNNDDNKMTD